MKTIKQHLSELPEPYRSEALVDKHTVGGSALRVSRYSSDYYEARCAGMKGYYHLPTAINRRDELFDDQVRIESIVGRYAINKRCAGDKLTPHEKVRHAELIRRYWQTTQELKRLDHIISDSYLSEKLSIK